MEQEIKNKIFLLEELVERVKTLQGEGKTIVQSHGIFDLVHPGIIKHLNSAKSQGDVLIVTVVRSKDVKRGSGRPIFPEDLRVENVASLAMVDYVCLVDEDTPFECVQRIKPNVFAKGQAYKERDRKIHEKIYNEEKELYFGKSTIYETDGFHFSSSQIINNFLNLYPEETKEYLKEISNKYSFQYILDQLNDLKNLKVLLIGDGILDEYHYVSTMGKSAKTNVIVNKYMEHEVFAGGAFAIANHVASICDKIHLVTLLGDSDSKEGFIKHNLKPSVSSKFFYRDDGPTIVKKRYVHRYLNQKLFEINYLNDVLINDDIEREVIKYLESEVPKYDLVLISDFGHGFITKNIFEVIAGSSVMFGVNTQTNGANIGYNLITKYHNPNYVCLDESEARLAVQEKFANLEDVLKILTKSLDPEYLIVTMGKKGSIGINRKNEINRTPVFSSKVIDTVGAGDAFFAYTAPCFASRLPLDLVSFIGNIVGALAVQIVGNKRSIEKYEVLEFIHTILK